MRFKRCLSCLSKNGAILGDRMKKFLKGMLFVALACAVFTGETFAARITSAGTGGGATKTIKEDPITAPVPGKHDILKLFKLINQNNTSTYSSRFTTPTTTTTGFTYVQSAGDLNFVELANALKKGTAVDSKWLQLVDLQIDEALLEKFAKPDKDGKSCFINADMKSRFRSILLYFEYAGTKMYIVQALEMGKWSMSGSNKVNCPAARILAKWAGGSYTDAQLLKDAQAAVQAAKPQVIETPPPPVTVKAKKTGKSN